MKNRLPLLALALAMSVTGDISLAQGSIQTPAARSFAEPDGQWTVRHGQTDVELLPQLRIQLPGRTGDGDGASARQLQVRISAASDADIGAGQYGVVFNHAMQAYGAITGEVSFLLPQGSLAQAQAVADQVGLTQTRRLGNSNYYVARATSAQQLRDSLLQMRGLPQVREARWVVMYDIPTQGLDSARRALR